MMDVDEVELDEVLVLGALAVEGGVVALREAVDAAWHMARVPAGRIEVALREAIADGRIHVYGGQRGVELELSSVGHEWLDGCSWDLDLAMCSAPPGDQPGSGVDEDHRRDLDGDEKHRRRKGEPQDQCHGQHL